MEKVKKEKSKLNIKSKYKTVMNKKGAFIIMLLILELIFIFFGGEIIRRNKLLSGYDRPYIIVSFENGRGFFITDLGKVYDYYSDSIESLEALHNSSAASAIMGITNRVSYVETLTSSQLIKIKDIMNHYVKDGYTLQARRDENVEFPGAFAKQSNGKLEVLYSKNAIMENKKLNDVLDIINSIVN